VRIAVTDDPMSTVSLSHPSCGNESKIKVFELNVVNERILNNCRLKLFE
jgi:hypothetical protein